MKRLILILALILPCIFAQALTVNDLIKKYKNFPEASYMEADKKQLRNQIDSVSSEAEKETLHSLNKMKILLMGLDDEQTETLTSDLNSLKNYSLTMSFSSSNEQKEPENLLQSAINSCMDLSMTTDIYSKDSSSDQYLLNPILVIKVWEMTALIYLDGKLKPDNAKELVKASFNSNTSLTPL